MNPTSKSISNASVGGATTASLPSINISNPNTILGSQLKISMILIKLSDGMDLSNKSSMKFKKTASIAKRKQIPLREKIQNKGFQGVL